MNTFLLIPSVQLLFGILTSTMPPGSAQVKFSHRFLFSKEHEEMDATFMEISLKNVALKKTLGIWHF